MRIMLGTQTYFSWAAKSDTSNIERLNDEVKPEILIILLQNVIYRQQKHTKPAVISSVQYIFAQKLKFSHCLLDSIPTGSRVLILHTQSFTEKQVFSWTTEGDKDLF